MMRRGRGRLGRQGFTVVELMAALTAGLIAISSIYYISASSSRHFQEQQRVAQTQMALRMATDQIRSDLARAGYLGTPNSATETTCIAPAAPLLGLTLQDGADSGSLTLAGTNNAEADRLRMVGNYATSDSYLAVGLSAGGNQVALQDQWQGFRRSFGAPFNAALFNAAFQIGRMLHIRTLQGNHFFVTITGVNGGASPPQVTFNPPLPIGGACTGGLASGAMVAPLVQIEYAVVPMDAAQGLGNLRNAAAGALSGVNGPVLVRRELNFATGAVVAGTTQIVTEYVAEFDVDFIMDTALAGAAPNLVTQLDGVAAATLAANPEQARTALVQLSVRTAAEDPRFPFTPRAAGGPLTSYELLAAGDGAARVRTARTEVFLSNFVPGGL